MKDKEEALKEKKQVMLQWKKAYIEALIDELRPFGDVLEVRYGQGYSSDRIQTFHPKSHTIIEQNPENVAETKAWAAKYPNVSILVGTWQTELPKLGIFDTIFFNDYPIDNEMGLMNRINPEEIAQTSKQAKELLNNLQSQLSQMKIQYSDKDIEDFYQKTGQFNMAELPNFFKKLKEYGYITEKQYQQVVQKYQLDQQSKIQAEQPQGDNTFTFLDECLKNHMRKGSRFSCFSKDIISKYEDAQFFDHIITNPFLDYNEKTIPIQIPKFSEHYKFNEALVMVVEKF